MSLILLRNDTVVFGVLLVKWYLISSAFLGILLTGRRSVVVLDCYGTLRELCFEFCAINVAVSIGSTRFFSLL